MVKKEQKKSLIKRNILLYLDTKGISKYAFYNLTGIARGTLDNNSGFTEEGIAKFIAHYEGINIEWLITSKGPMEKDGSLSLNEDPVTYNANCPKCKDKDRVISILEENNQLLKEKVQDLKLKISASAGTQESISKTA